MGTVRSAAWGIAGLALAISIGSGVLLGEQASAELQPFRGMVAARAPAGNGAPTARVVGDAGPPTETPDFGYAQAMQNAPSGDMP